MKLARLLSQEGPLGTLVNTGSPAFGGTATTPQNLAVTIAKILNVAFGLLGIIFVVLFVYAGFLYMTSMGIEERINKSKKTMISAVIGLVIILTSYAITKTVMYYLTRSIEPSQPWQN